MQMCSEASEKKVPSLNITQQSTSDLSTELPAVPSSELKGIR